MLRNACTLASPAILATVLLLGGCQSPFMAKLWPQDRGPSPAADIVAVPPPPLEEATPEADAAAALAADRGASDRGAGDRITGDRVAGDPGWAYRHKPRGQARLTRPSAPTVRAREPRAAFEPTPPPQVHQVVQAPVVPAPIVQGPIVPAPVAREPAARTMGEGPILIQPGGAAQRTTPDPPAPRTAPAAAPGPKPASLAPPPGSRPAALAPVHAARPGSDSTPY